MIIAVHGFLGRSEDWRPFSSAFHDGQSRPHEFFSWDLYRDVAGLPVDLQVNYFDFWAKQFCEKVRALYDRPVLMGYSLGGRLALHALLHDPSLWSAAIIVSAHPGLIRDDLREQRRLNDAHWVERFRRDDWNTLMRAWEGQEIFRNPSPAAGAIRLQRAEAEFDRAQLARALQVWSLADQRNLRPSLAELNLPVLWVTGEQDRRYQSLLKDVMIDLIDSPAQTWVEIAQSAHRVPWDNPLEFIRVARNFLSQFP